MLDTFSDCCVLSCVRAATACLRKINRKKHEIRNRDGAFKLLSRTWSMKRRKVGASRMTNVDIKTAKKESEKFAKISRIVYVGSTPRQG
jgi:hypothetical protein